MKTLRAWLIILVLITACSPNAIASPAPTNTPIPVDEFAIYRLALTTANQNDLALLDRPTRYGLTLNYNADPPTLTGSQDVLYFNRQTASLNEIYFRLFANYPASGGKITVTNLSVNGAATIPTLEAKDTALRVPLVQPLQPNASVNLHLDFTIAIPRASKNRYADFGTSDTVVAMPSVYPLIPGYDAQGWHIEVPPPYGDLVYADVSLYTVTMTVPATMTVIASGSTIDTRDNNDDTKTWKMVGAPMRDFDLNVTSQLQKASTTIGETTINSWYEPSDAEGGKKALQFATDALRVFQTRFGAYPYRELDVVETPTSAGGIEYPGTIVISRNLYKDTREQEFFEFATAHEVSHQWWYGVVGDDQVNHPWVDESLAQYSTLIYYGDAHGANAAQVVLKNVFQDAYNRAKNAGHDAAVSQPVAAFNEADYSAIVYDKGPLFYDAIRKKMGNDLFFKFLGTYYERYRYKIAFPEDILKTAEDTCACALREEYQQWITSPAPK